MDNAGRVFLGPPKTAASYRTVPLPQTVIDALAAYLALFPAPEVQIEDRTGRKPVWVTVRLIFTSPKGKGIRRNRFHESWARAVRDAGLEKGTRFHQFRHPYASSLIAAKEPPLVIQRRLGHSSISETMDTYGHLYREADESTRAAVDAWFRPAVDQDQEARGSDA